ncbi:putative reverse transcriptase domain-containing protein [Tanacetum coccineum]
MVHFIPCKKTSDVVAVVQLYFRDAYRLHGLSASIVSDRDTHFVSHFWRSLWRLVNTQLNFSSAYHPQTDSQTEVVNRSLGNLLRSLVGDHPKAWDQKWPQAKFAHNHDVNRSTVSVLFMCWLKFITHAHLVAATAKYKEKADQKRRAVDFDAGDFVWVILNKDRFPAHEYSKLAARKIGPVEIVEKINPNAYRLRLPSHVRTSYVFNVKHLVPFLGDSSSNEDDAVPDSRSNLLYPGGNDAVQFEEVFMQKRAHPKFLRNCHLEG